MSGLFVAYSEADAVLEECRNRGIGFTLIVGDSGFTITDPVDAMDEILLERIQQSWSKISERLRAKHKDTICQRCGSIEHVEIPIHEGKAVRRDCAKCGRFITFPLWKGTKKNE